MLPPFPCLKHLQAINPSFVTSTNLSGNKIKETFCERLKWMCKLFEINSQQVYYRLVIFLISSKHFVIEFAQGDSYQFCLISFSDSGILSFFPLSYNGKNLSLKFLKTLYQYILFCKL